MTTTPDRVKHYDAVALAAATDGMTVAEFAEMKRDAERYRWLRDVNCNSFYIDKNGDKAANYMTAEEWIERNPEEFEHVSAEEISHMKAKNTIWSLQVYPNTPIGFYIFSGSTLDVIIDGAMKEES